MERWRDGEREGERERMGDGEIGKTLNLKL